MENQNLSGNRGAPGLDYFGARYFASSMGRWMSPDWGEKPMEVPYAQYDDPQSLNLYGYVRNNPITGIDADGHDWSTNQITGKVTCTNQEGMSVAEKNAEMEHEKVH